MKAVKCFNIFKTELFVPIVMSNGAFVLKELSKQTECNSASLMENNYLIKCSMLLYLISHISVIPDYIVCFCK